MTAAAVCVATLVALMTAPVTREALGPSNAPPWKASCWNVQARKPSSYTAAMMMIWESAGSARLFSAQ